MMIGGTRFSLLPTLGGETRDALLVHMPDQGVLFTGDIFMPYFGAPFAEEGSVDGLLTSIDQVNGLAPRLLLHGHEPLTRIFDSTRMLAELRAPLAWLREQVLRGIAGGEPRAAMQQANLVAPTLEHGASSVHLAYLVLRENLINRVFDQNSGYWQGGLQGLDTLSDADHGAALLDYLDVDESRLVAAAQRMAADGRHELAAATLRAALAYRPTSGRLREANRDAYTRLMEQNQEFNPFKLILYSAAGRAAGGPAGRRKRHGRRARLSLDDARAGALTAPSFVAIATESDTINPRPEPIATSRPAWVITRRMMAYEEAPSAMRLPISFVRWLKPQVTTPDKPETLRVARWRCAGYPSRTRSSSGTSAARALRPPRE